MRDVRDLGKEKEKEKRGGMFGEISLLGRATAVADVVSTRPGFALLLPAPDFREVIMTHPQFLEAVTTLSDERREVNQTLVGY